MVVKAPSGSSFTSPRAAPAGARPMQGSVWIGLVAMLFALLLVVTPPLALLAQAREKPAPAMPRLPIETRFA